MTHTDYEWHQLEFPTRLEADAVASFVRVLASRPRRGLLLQCRPLVIEIDSAGHDGLRWRLGLSRQEASLALRLLHAQLPEVRHQPTEIADRHVDRAWELRTSHHRRPLRTDVAETTAATLLGALRSTRSGERALLQVVIGPWLPRRPVQSGSKAQLGQVGPLPAWNDWLVTSELAGAIRTKQKESLFGTCVRVGVSATTGARTAQLRQGIIGALQLLREPGNGFERRLVPAAWGAIRAELLQHPLVGWPCTLNALELASCLGFPIGGPVLPGVSYGGGRQLPPPDGALISVKAKLDDFRLSGEVTYPGLSGFVGIRPSDGLRHTHAIGPTGSGKSVLLAGLALADIRAGRGAVVLDMKGDLPAELADRVPKDRLDDVVLMEPDAEQPVGFNVLSGAQPDIVVDQIVHVMQELFAGSWGPRTADVMTNGLMTLLRHGNLTLVELPVLLTNRSFRRQVLTKVGGDELGVGPFWHTFEALSDGEQAAVVGPSLNKLRAFCNRELTRRVIGQTAGFDLRQVFTERKVLLVNLSKGRLGSENAQLLGSLLVGNLWSLIQQRVSVPPERRHPVFVYLDEFQELMRLPTDLGDALAQARGLGVGLVLAHQNLAQLSPAIQAATLNNARSRVTFACAADDAKVLARNLGSGLQAEDLQRLPVFETYQALCVGGVTAPPASVRTRPLPPPLGTLAEVRRRSQARYGQLGTTVDDELRARRRPLAGDQPVGTRKRGGQS